MPPKQCAKCTKTVYPTEELKCLDKVWHKGCFRCQACNMTLNMKNYKGYEKLPYCNAHYPQTKFTAVADTPENRRISENTKIQSNIHYHKDFDASKDRYTQVADTPELRAVNRNKDYSMIKYHAEFEKQKGSKITIADDPEVQRVRQNMNVISNISYHGERDRKEEMEKIRPAEQVEDFTNCLTPSALQQLQNMQAKLIAQRNQPYSERRTSGSTYSGGAMAIVQEIKEGEEQEQEAGRHRQNPGRIADYDPDERIAGGGSGGTPYSNRNSAGARQVYDSSIGREDEELTTSTTSPGRMDAGRRISQGSVRNRVSRFSSSGDEEQAGVLEQPQSRKVGSIHDYDPLNENYGSIAGQKYQDNRRDHAPPQQQYQPPPQQYQPPPPVQPPQPQPPRDKFYGKGLVCQAMYDYDAADTDEVSFRDGDIIIQCEAIDAGWMEGTVEKTGQRGMLPSNYVERLN